MRQQSTTTNLLECTHESIFGLSNSNNIDVVYVDFKKAFDSIVFSKLLLKLEKYGVTGTLQKWLSGFIRGRIQRVVIENCFSSFNDVVNGVLQALFYGLECSYYLSMT